MHQMVLVVRCKIKRAAFSGERIVVLRMGEKEYRAIVPVHYCRTSADQELTELMPAAGSELDGTVKILANISDESVVLALPDGEFISVGRKDIDGLLAA